MSRLELPPPASSRARMAASLGLLLLWMACSITPPDGTRWSAPLGVITAPETLRVSDLLERDDVSLVEDSLLLFRQELDTVWANFGDSLLWRGAQSTLRWEVGALNLDNLGNGAVDLPFVAAWPQYAGLVGGSSQISGQATCDLEVPLPAWPSMEWVAFSQATFDLSIRHQWPFPLQWLDISLLNSSGQSLASLHVEPSGGLPAGQTRMDLLSLSGLMDQNCRLRVQARHLPMAAAAPIANTELALELVQRSGTADSARAHIPAQAIQWADVLEGDDHIRITHAATGPMVLRLDARNSTNLAMAVNFTLPQFREQPQDQAYAVDLNLAAQGSLELTELSQSLEIQEEAGLREVQVEASAQCTAGSGMVTVRSGDALELDVICEALQLESFQGWFAQELRVPMPPQRTTITEWPEELAALRMEGLDMRLHLWNNARVEMASEIRLVAESSQGDTVYSLDPALGSLDSVLWVEDMVRLIERLPDAITVSGMLVLPAGSMVDLNEESRIGIGALSIPGRGRLRQLEWESQPERQTDAVPEEAQHLSMEARVESWLPVGGHLRGEVAAPGAAWVELFAVDLGAAAANGGAASRDTLEFDLSPAAFAILRLPEWDLRYRFAADDTGQEVEIHAGQFLVVQSLLKADVDVEVEAP